ncbi:MAG: GNAT family N-acetyltransferase [bacterium]|nr:GNAT family N-acetyltransferase [bacterium]
MIFTNLPVLSTERLILRKVTPEDAHDIFVYASDQVVNQFMLWPRHESIKDAYAVIDTWIKAYAKNKPAPWVIVDKKSQRLIGTCGFKVWDERDYNAELGYVLNREFWGKGLMVEAVNSVIDFCFSNTKLNRIYAYCEERNERSRRVLEKIGMQREGILREAQFRDGQFFDIKVYALLKREQKHG